MTSAAAFSFGSPPSSTKIARDHAASVQTINGIVALLNAGHRTAALDAIDALDRAGLECLSITLVGLVAHAAGAPEKALSWLDAALFLDPFATEALKARATVLADLQRLPEANIAFELAFVAGCNDAVAHFRHGNVLRGMGLRDAAIAAYDRALQRQAAFPEALRAGAGILHETGRLDAALQFIDEALRLRPDFLEAILDRANMLGEADREIEALATLDRGLARLGESPQLLNNKGVILFRLGRYDEALGCLDRAIERDASLASAFLNKGDIEIRQGRYDDALRSLDQAILLRPVYTEAQCARGLALKLAGRFDEARQAFEQALRDDPGSVYARTNRGELKLLLGEFEDGWRDYDFRFATRGHDRPVLLWPVPEWAGERDPGKVVVFVDQAAGDVIHFARYVPVLRAAGADITLVCRPRMQRLLRHVSEGCTVIGSMPDRQPFAYQIPLSNMPFACRTDTSTMPVPPYILAEADLAAHWRQTLGPHGFKIGLCWRGSQDFRSDPKRSVPLAMLRPLAKIPGVRIISLQMPDNIGPDRDSLAAMAIEDPGPLDMGADGFVETAAMMAGLDLVVSCDTSILHLAGALGCRTFALLQSVPEWRFMLEREDCPWYPTMRLFRQTQQDEWDQPVARLVEAVAALAGAARADLV